MAAVTLARVTKRFGAVAALALIAAAAGAAWVSAYMASQRH